MQFHNYRPFCWNCSHKWPVQHQSRQGHTQQGRHLQVPMPWTMSFPPPIQQLVACHQQLRQRQQLGSWQSLLLLDMHLGSQQHKLFRMHSHSCVLQRAWCTLAGKLANQHSQAGAKALVVRVAARSACHAHLSSTSWGQQMKLGAITSRSP